jgi:tRNA threonylcarbamoyladenosine biosynthesis protein TsaE
MASIICASAEATRQYGHDLAQQCRGGEVFALTGPLGAGKTHLVKGLAEGLGYPGEVTSPTFTLIHEYEGGRLPLYHFDLYRLTESQESRRLGLDDYLYCSGICAVEWPERIPGLFPPHTRWLEITIVSPAERRIVLT